MRGGTIEIAPERVAEGKRLYEMTSTPVPDIAAMMGMSRRTLQRRVSVWGWVPRSGPRHVTERALVAAALAVQVAEVPVADAVCAPVTPAARAALAAKLHDTVNRSLDAVNRILDKNGPADEAGSERSARTMAAVARTLGEIAVLIQPPETTPADETDDDPVPRDIDEFRFELARRIRGFVEARQGGAGGLPADPEAPLA